jgi:toxin FitB
MIILDTNVISEMMRPQPASSLRSWLNAQNAETLFITSITVAELRFGVGCLPEGRRRQHLASALDAMFAMFGDRVLAFDAAAASVYADRAVMARFAGKGLSLPDGYIAAIAASRQWLVATRDTAPYEAAAVRVVNPWTTET